MKRTLLKTIRADWAVANPANPYEWEPNLIIPRVLDCFSNWGYHQVTDVPWGDPEYGNTIVTYKGEDWSVNGIELEEIIEFMEGNGYLHMYINQQDMGGDEFFAPRIDLHPKFESMMIDPAIEVEYYSPGSEFNEIIRMGYGSEWDFEGAINEEISKTIISRYNLLELDGLDGNVVNKVYLENNLDLLISEGVVDEGGNILRGRFWC